MRAKEILKAALIVTGSLGAGYGGAELHKIINPPGLPPPSEEVFPTETKKWVIDANDRTRIANERINDIWRAVVFLDSGQKRSDQRLGELEEYTGVNRPKLTPKPRSTASERLKP